MSENVYTISDSPCSKFYGIPSMGEFERNQKADLVYYWDEIQQARFDGDIVAFLHGLSDYYRTLIDYDGEVTIISGNSIKYFAALPDLDLLNDYLSQNYDVNVTPVFDAKNLMFGKSKEHALYWAYTWGLNNFGIGLAEYGSLEDLK